MIRDRNGFSLPELLAVVALMGLSVGIGFATVDTVSWRANAGSAVVARQLDVARSQAVIEQNDYVIDFDVTGGVIEVLDDNDSDGGQTASLGERTLQITVATEGRGVALGYVSGALGLDGQPIAAAVTFPGTPPRLTFDALGRGDAGVIYLVPEEHLGNGEPTHMRALSVNAATGRIRRWRYDESQSTPGPWRLER